MICIKDNTLSEEEIKKLLEFTNYPNEKWGDSFTVDINHNHPSVTKILNQSVDNKFKNVELAQIVSYPLGGSMPFHFDHARKTTTGASITFLNDNFIGGEALVEAIKISPIKGRTYYFDGRMYKHAVLNVVKGIRHTLSIWYKNG